MIKINLSGRLGNQLFQVAFAYILSKKVTQKVIVKVKPNSKFGFWLEGFNTPVLFSFLPTKAFLWIHFLLFKLLKADFVLKENSCLNPVSIPEESFNHILLDGYFQDARLLMPFKKDLVRVFNLKRNIQNSFSKKYSSLISGRILVVNLRLREYSNHYFEEIGSTPYIDPSWYYNVLGLINLSEFNSKIVISDDIEHAKTFLSKLNDDFIFIDDEWHVDFQFLLVADTLIIPNSSFSWWGAFLNSKKNKEVFAPNNWVGNNVGIEYPKGIMINEFIWV